MRHIVSISLIWLVTGSVTLADTTAEPSTVATGGVALEEIVVTAQKRKESAQSIPIAITALSGNALSRAGVDSVVSLQDTVPNVNIGQQLGVAQVAIRGVGLDNLSTAAEGSVALNKNDVFMSRPVAALSSFYDVDRIEVLRGPQGTLYGRNSTGGSINIITRDPTNNYSGYAELTVGNYNRVRLEGALSGPLKEGVLLGRIAFQADTRDGYGTNVATGHEIDNSRTQSIRATLLYLPNDQLRVKLIAEYHRENDASGGYHYLGAAGLTATGISVIPTGVSLGGTVAPNVRDISNDVDPSLKLTTGGVTADISYNLGSMDLRSITATQGVHYNNQADLDSTSFPLAPIVQVENSNQFSQEFHVAGTSHATKWLAGLYYFHEHNNGFLTISPFNDLAFGGPGIQRQGFFGGGIVKTDAAAVFGQLKQSFTDALSITLGGRYSWERKTIDNALAFDLATPYLPGGPYSGAGQCSASVAAATCIPTKTWQAFTPRVVGEYQATPDFLFYASASKGFKSGTYNDNALQPPVNPETLWAYEGGVKSESFDHRVRVNVAAFYYKYANLQVDKIVNAGQQLENAASATIYGGELEMTVRPTTNWEFGLAASALHAVFDNFISVDPSRPAGDGITVDGGNPAFNLAGNSLERAPKWTADASGQYFWDLASGNLSLRGEIVWTDRVYFSPFDRNVDSQAAHGKVNGLIRFLSADQKWDISAYGRNLTNKTLISSGFVSSSLVGFPVNGYLEDPRTYGLRVKYSF
jgi:iron complex outermembrane receptor protein